MYVIVTSRKLSSLDRCGLLTLLCGHGTADLLQCCSEGQPTALKALDDQDSVT